MNRLLIPSIAALLCAACVADNEPPAVDTPAQATVRCEMPAADGVRGDAVDHAEVPLGADVPADACAEARELVAVTAHLDALMELTEEADRAE